MIASQAGVESPVGHWRGFLIFIGGSPSSFVDKELIKVGHDILLQLPVEKIKIKQRKRNHCLDYIIIETFDT